MGGADLGTKIKSRHSTLEMSYLNWYGLQNGDVELAVGYKKLETVFNSHQPLHRRGVLPK